MQTFTAAWLALAITLSGATQLRAEAFPIGPGEVLLAGWLLFVLFLLLRGAPFVLGPPFRAIGGFWLISCLLLALGTAFALATNRFEPYSAQHSGLALAFTALTSSAFALGLYPRDDFPRRLARLTFLVVTGSSIGLLVVSMAVPQLGSLQLWYYGVRFSGLAENPNQMALMIAAMPFLGWYLMRRAATLPRQLLDLALIGGAVVVGFATGSDGLSVSWLGALVVIAGVAWLRGLARRRGVALYLSCLAVPIVIGTAVTLGGPIVEQVWQASQEVYETQNQGSVRLRLWSNGLEAISSSLLVGYGPGSYSGLHRPFAGAEAHNSFIDWGMSTGLLGLALYLVLVGWTAWRALKAGSLALFGVVATLTAFAVFGYVLRQPVYWLLMALCLSLSTPAQRTAPARQPPPSVSFRRRAPAGPAMDPGT